MGRDRPLDPSEPGGSGYAGPLADERAAPRSSPVPPPPSPAGWPTGKVAAADEGAAGGENDSVARRRLDALVSVARAATAMSNHRELVEYVAETTRRALDAASVSLSRLEPERGRVRVLVNVGDLGPGGVRWPDEETFRVADRPELKLLVEQHTGYTTQVNHSQSSLAEQEMLVRRGKSASLAVPILFEGRVWGQLWAARAWSDPPFTPGDLAFAEAVATQISASLAQAEMRERLTHLAYTDPLTGLPNRRWFDERLADALREYHEGGPAVALVVADVDGLKRVNDTHGHDAGDKVLRHVAGAVSDTASLLPQGLGARIGGDEFALLVVGTPRTLLTTWTERLSRAAAEAAPHEIGLSCGIGTTEQMEAGSVTPHALFRLADQAQYVRKRGIKGRDHTTHRDMRGVNRRALRRASGHGLGADLGFVRDVLAMLHDASSNAGPDVRLAAVTAVAAEVLEANDWLLSSRTQRVLWPLLDDHGAIADDDSRGTIILTEEDDAWLAEAERHGTVLGSGQHLVRLRDASSVLLAAHGPWVVELHFAPDSAAKPADLETTAPLLRALIAVAANA
jgi:diguanylate cyclase (GGDEF)-like protein